MKKLLLYFLLLPALAFGQISKKQMFFQLASSGGVANDAPTISSITVTGTTTLSAAYVYDDNESDVEDNQLPTATPSFQTSRRYVGQVLNGSYNYTHINGEAEGATTYKWFRADDTNGTNETEIATTVDYTLAVADNSKYIRFQVIPITSSGITGATVTSDYSSQILTFDPYVHVTHWTVALDPSTASADLASSFWENKGSGSNAAIGATALPTWDGGESKVRFTRTSSQSFYVPAGVSFAAPATIWIKFKTPSSFTGFQGLVALSSTQNTYYSSGGTLTVGSVGTASTLSTNTNYTLKIKINGASSVYSLNGGADTAVSLGALAGTPTVRLGCWYADSNYFNGWITNVFISETGTTDDEDALIKTWFGF
jgi:hypothetical protein